MFRTLAVGIVCFVLGGLGYGTLQQAGVLSALRTHYLGERAYRAMAAARPRIDCPDAPVLLVLGQSNAANSVADFLYVPRHRQVNFDALDGTCRPAAEPLLGMWPGGHGDDAGRGSIWTLVGDGLIERGGLDTVVLAPIAVGGSSVADWSDGTLSGRLERALAGLRAAGLRVRWVAWHQGERDAGAGMAAADYTAHLRRVVGRIRAAGVEAPVYVAVATMCGNAGSEAIRRAQRDLPARLPGVRGGPDTDELSSIALRYDGCHFNEAGARLHAAAWVSALLRDAPQR